MVGSCTLLPSFVFYGPSCITPGFRVKVEVNFEHRFLKGVAMKKSKEGYTLIELVVVMLFVAAFAAIAIPRLNFATVTKKGAEVTAYRFLSELRRTRALAIANAASNPNGFGIWINPTGAMAPDGPVVYTAGLLAFGESNVSSRSRTVYYTYEIRNLMTGETVDTQEIYDNVNIGGGTQFSFSPLGNLTSGDTSLQVGFEGTFFVINITISTGSMTCAEHKENYYDAVDGTYPDSTKVDPAGTEAPVT